MTKFSKYFIWFYMLTKRLLKQWSFVVLLCLIPCIMLLVNLAMSKESGVVHIMLSTKDNDPKAAAVVDSLIEQDSNIRFSKCDSPEYAEKAVKNHKADAAWIFADNYSEKIDENAKKANASEPLVTIIERESSVFLKIANEKLFGAVFGDLSYSIYENFVYKTLVSKEDVPESTVKEYYEKRQKGQDIVLVERLDSKPVENKVTYLTAPVRGILSLMVVLCTLTAAMIFLKEQSQKKFSWLPARKRIIPATASCFSAAVLSALAVFATLMLSGNSTSLTNEMITMLLFVFATTGFCTVLLTLFNSAGKFGAMIPGIIIIMLALSPIFFNVKVLRPVRLMLPTYYYIHSVYNYDYYQYTVIYCVAAFAIAFVLNFVFAERKSKNV